MLRKVIVIIGIILLTFSFTAGAAEKKGCKGAASALQGSHCTDKKRGD